MDLVFVDLETTGAVAQRDRITEIAVIRVRNGVEVARWSSLVNPQCHISSFIERLTHISDELVADAPTFAELADTIREQLADAVFVAHNARFDYSFLKNEFTRLQQTWQAKVLCTVKLSRRLYPEHRKHGLDQLIARHQLPCSARHRALGDTEATVAFYQHCLQDKGEDTVAAVISALLQRPALPPSLPADVLESIPAVPGIYRFYGEQDNVLYVGKSIDISQRVRSHFSADHRSQKEQQLTQQTHHIDWQQTAGDLGAQLLELQEIARLKPLHNRRTRGGVRDWFSIRLQADQQGYWQCEIRPGIELEHLDQHYGLFATYAQAMKALKGLVHAHHLCVRRSGIEMGSGSCLGVQLGQCKGACIGEESPERYNLRTELALSSLKLQPWPWDGPIGVHEHHQFTGMSQFHVFWRWCHIVTLTDEQQWYEWCAQGADALAHAHFDKPVYQLLQRYLFSGQANGQVMVLEGLQ